MYSAEKGKAFLTSTFCIFLFVTSLTCQSQAVQGLIGKADSLAKTNELDSALKYYESASYLYLQNRDTASFLNTGLKMIDLAYKMIDYDLMEKLAQGALEIVLAGNHQDYTREQAVFHRNLGLVTELRDGDFSKAILKYKKALELVEKNNPKDFLLIELSKDIAVGLLSLGKLDSSEVVLEQTIDSQQSMFPEKKTELADLYRLLGIRYSFTADHDKALNNYAKAQNLLMSDSLSERAQLSRADILGNMAATFQLDGYYDSALYYYYKQKSINERLLEPHHRNLSFMQNNLSQVHLIKGDFDSAYYYSYSSIESRLKVIDPSHPNMADSYAKLASILVRANKLDLAILYFEKAYDVALKVYGENHSFTYDVTSDLAHTFYLKEEFTKSMALYNRAIAIHNHGSFSMGQSIVFNHLGLAYNLMELKRYGDGLATLTKAEKIALKLFQGDHETIGRIELLKAELNLGLGNLPKANEQAEHSYTILTKNNGQRNIHVSHSLYLQAKVLMAKEQYKEALEVLNKAIEANSYNFTINETKEAFGLTEMLDRVKGIELNQFKAALLKSQFLKDENPKWIEQSYQEYKKTVKLLLEYLFEIESESDLSRTLESFNKLYGQLVETIDLLYAHSIFEDNQYAKELISASEDLRAMDIVMERFRRSKRTSSVGTSYLDSIKHLNKQISFTKSQLLTSQLNPDSLEASYFKSMLVELNTKKTLLLRKGQPERFEYRDFDVYTRHQDLEIRQSVVAPSQAILKYIISEDWLYFIIVTHESVEVLKRRLSDNIDEEIALFLNMKDDLKAYAQSAFFLYNELLKPLEHVLKSKTQLIIIPDKNLWNINFDLLLDTQPKEINAKKLPYLLRKFQISYAYSLRLYFQSLTHRNNKEVLAMSYGGLRYSQEGVNTVSNALEGAAVEIQSLSKKFSGRFLIGPQATEKEFKRLASDFAIIHLALHGVISDENEEAYIIFNKDEREDARLYTFELHDLQLNADLAILSACSTGAGKIKSGQGLMSVGRAFHYAGVNSLMLSSWELSDAIAPEIMEYFYQYLSEGYNKSESLQRAKIQFLTNSNNLSSNPYYWGSLFILGDVQPLELQAAIDYDYIIKRAFLILLSLGLVVLIIRHYRVKREPK